MDHPDAPAFSFEQLGAYAIATGSAEPGHLPTEAERRTELEAVRAEAYQQGQQDAQAQLASAVTAFGQALAEVNREKANAADQLEREAVDLGMQVAEKVVAGAISVKPEIVLAVVTGALRRLVERQVVAVLVNPEDLEIVREGADALRTDLGGIDRLDIQSERRVPRGGCVLRTAAGEVDARVGAQLERAREAVEAELGG